MTMHQVLPLIPFPTQSRIDDTGAETALGYMGLLVFGLIALSGIWALIPDALGTLQVLVIPGSF